MFNLHFVDRLHKQKVKSILSKFRLDTQYLKSGLMKVKTDSKGLVNDINESVATVETKIQKFAKVCHDGKKLINLVAKFTSLCLVVVDSINFAVRQKPFKVMLCLL